MMFRSMFSIDGTKIHQFLILCNNGGNNFFLVDYAATIGNGAIMGSRILKLAPIVHGM